MFDAKNWCLCSIFSHQWWFQSKNSKAISTFSTTFILLCYQYCSVIISVISLFNPKSFKFGALYETGDVTLLISVQFESFIYFITQHKRLFLLLNSIFAFAMNVWDLLLLSSFLHLHLPWTIPPLGIDLFNPDFPVASSLFVLPEIWALTELMIHPALPCHWVHDLTNVLFQN